MRVTFLDTSFLLALGSSSDSLHARAVAWSQRVTGALLTTEFVLLELADAWSTPGERSLAMSTLDDLEASPRVKIVRASAELVREGKKLYRMRADKGWGLTDCISFHVMKQRRVMNALTHDQHFEQAGFRALLRSDPSEN